MNLREKDNCGIENSLKRLVEFSKSQPTRSRKFFPLSQTEKDDFTCADCGSVFITKFLLTLHCTTQCVLLPHACTKCDLRFATRASLLHHRRIHWKSKPSKDCNKSDSDQIESSSVVTYKCDDCSLAFRGPSKFLRHRRLHNGKESFQCHRCNLGFNWKSNLTRHLKTPCFRDELEGENRNRTSRRKYSLSRHTVDHNKGRSREIRVPKNCVLKMETTQGEICKTEKSDGIELDLMQTGVQSEQKTIKVEESIPTGNENKESLKIADKNSDKNKTLKSPCKQYMEVSPRRYECKHCDMGFKYKSDLLRHLGTHDIIKPFQCDYCELGFNWKSNLVRHQRRFHFGIKVYGCDKCDLSFVKKYHLSRHKKIHPEETDTDFTPKSKVHRPRKNPNGDIPFESSDLDMRRDANNIAILQLDQSVEKLDCGLTIKQENNPEQLHKSPARRKKRGKYKSRIKSGENKTEKQFGDINVDGGTPRKTEKCVTGDETGITQDLITQIVNIKGECNEDSKGASSNGFNSDKSLAVNTVALQSTSYTEKSSVKTGESIILKQEINEFQRRRRGKYKSRVKRDLNENRKQSEEVIPNGAVKDENYLINRYSDITQDLESIAQMNISNCNDKSKDKPIQSDIPDGNFTSIKSNRGKKRKSNPDPVETEIKQFPCSYCDRVFSRRSSHFQHERSHKRKPVLCEICRRSFERKSVLQRHYLTHTGEKPFKCDICCKCFRQKSQLVQHMRIHSGARPHECETCMQRFNRRSILKRHQVIHSGERPFQCDVCLHSFSRKSILDQHQIIHSERNGNHANDGEERFSRRKMLPQHERLHAGMTAASHTYNTRFSLKQENLDDCQDGTQTITLDQPAEGNRSLQNESNQEQMYYEANEHDERTSRSHLPQEQAGQNTNQDTAEAGRCYGHHSDQREPNYCMPDPDDLQDESNDQEQMYFKADELTNQSHNSQEQTHQNTKSQEMTKAGQIYVHHCDLPEPDYYMPDPNALTNIRHEDVQEPDYYEIDPVNSSLEKRERYKNEKIHFIQDPEHYESESTDESVEDLVKIPTFQKDPENFSHAKVSNYPDVRRLTIIHIQSSSHDKSQVEENSELPNKKREDCDETRSEEIQLSQINASVDDKHEISSAYQAFGRLKEFSNSESPVAENSENEISDQDFKSRGICDQECQVDSTNNENVSLLDDFSTDEIAMEQTDSINRKIDCFIDKLRDGNDVEDIGGEIGTKERLKHETSISTDRYKAIGAIEDHEYCIDLYSDFKNTDLKQKSPTESPKDDDLEINNTEDTEGISSNGDLVDGNSTSLETEHLISSNIDQTAEISEQNENACRNLELVRFEEIHLDQQPARYVEIRTDQDPIRCKEMAGNNTVMRFEVPIEQDLDYCEEMNIYEDFVRQEKMRVNQASNKRQDPEYQEDNCIADQDCENTQTLETLEGNSFPKLNNNEEIPDVSIFIQQGEINATELHVDTGVVNNPTLKNRDKEKFNANGNCYYPEESTNDPDSSSFVELSSDQNKNPHKLEKYSEKDLIQCEDISTTQNASQNEDFNYQVVASNEDIPIHQNLSHQKKTGSCLGREDIPSERCQLELHTVSDLSDQRGSSMNSLNTGKSSQLQLGTISSFDPTRSATTWNALDLACVEKLKPGHISKRSSKARLAKKRLKRQDSDIDKVLDQFKDISIEDVDYLQDDISRYSETRLQRITDQDQSNLYTQTHSENEKVFSNPRPAQNEGICTIQNPAFDEPFKDISIEDLDCHQDNISRYSKSRLQRITNHDQSYLYNHSENEKVFNNQRPAQHEGLCTIQNPAFDEPFISDQQAIQLVNEYVGYEKISIQQNITVEHFVGCGEISENDEQIRFMNGGYVRNPALPTQYNPVRFDQMPIRPAELFPDRNLVQREETYNRNLHGAVRYDQMYIHPLQFQENMRMAQSLVRNEEISSYSVQYEKISTDTTNQYSNFPIHPDKNVRIPKISYQKKLSKTIQSFQERNKMGGSDSKRNNLMSGSDSKRNKQVRSCYEKLRREVVRKHQEHASFGSKNQFGCERCDQCFKRKEDLIRHRFTEHEKNRF